MGQSIQLGLPGIPQATHTETALKFHDLWADETGAYLQVVGVWTGRYDTVADACFAAEKMGLVRS